MPACRMIHDYICRGELIFKARKLLSAIHMGLFFGLITYAFVNIMDVLEGGFTSPVR